jgi:ornithine cyclodeaminase
LFVSYEETLDLLSPADAMRICEQVYLAQARGSVTWPTSPNLKLDEPQPFHNHWIGKAALLRETAATGVRLYNYYDDGHRNNIGSLQRLGYVILSDPTDGRPLAIVDDHWTSGIRAAASPAVGCKWLAPPTPRVLGLNGVGTMAENVLRCLTHMYRFDEIRCTSRRPATREAFASHWSKALATPVTPVASSEEVACGADIVIGATTSSDVVCREAWLKPGALFISLARRELDPDDWARMDKVVVDSWAFNLQMPVFREMIESGLFARESLHAELQEIVSGAKPGRTRPDEKILIHTCGLASQDIAIAHHVFREAERRGRGIRLPVASTR